jgi:hypothetical protein
MSISQRKKGFPHPKLTAARAAIRRNRSSLQRLSPNVVHMMAAFFEEDGERIPCVHVCLKDGDDRNIPSYLHCRLRDGSTRQVKVHIISNFGNITPHAGLGETVFNSNTTGTPGTITCIVKNPDASVLFALTCNHVLTGKNFVDAGDPSQLIQENLLGSTVDIGPWSNGRMNTTVDVALAQVSDPTTATPYSLKNKTPFVPKDADCGVTAVKMQGAVSDLKTGFIIHIDQPMAVNYLNQKVTVTGLITISSSKNVFDFSPISVEGDSGALVYHAATEQPIGMILGGNTQFSFAMPFGAIINAFPPLSLSIF